MTRSYPRNLGGRRPFAADGLPDDDFDDEPGGEKHWRWVAGVAAAVLVAAVGGTVMILSGGDSGSTAGKVLPQASRPASPPPPAPPAPRPTSSALPTTSLPSETVTTLPRSSPNESPAPQAAPATDPRTVVYSVTGTREPGDLVSVTYTDEQGAFRTDLNVTLPWSRTVVLNPDVAINSVTATSFLSHLNCRITDAHGAVVASQSYNTIAATCNR